MGRTYRTKTTVNESLCLRITELTKKYRVLKDNSVSTQSMQWSSRGEKIGSISYTIDTTDSNYYFIRLFYKNTNNNNGETTDMDYKIELVKVKSNLPDNKGFRWYFVCPKTFKLCTLLVCSGKYFRSRDKSYVYYNCQTQSKNQRVLDMSHKYSYQELQNSELDFKSGKCRKYYKGVYTKNYTKLQQKYSKAVLASQMFTEYAQKLFQRLSKNT
jgi:hypothetical protein